MMAAQEKGRVAHKTRSKGERSMEDGEAVRPVKNDAVDLDDVSSDDDGASKATGQGKKKKSKGGFYAMKLSDETMFGIRSLGFKQPTPIQRKAIPPALLGRDVVAMARTGSGKTAAFLIPVIERLKVHVSSTRVVILSPTRELAQQTYKVGRSLAKRTDLRFCLLQGGDSLEVQFEALAASPDVIVATPGRLAHLLLEARDFSLGKVEVLVVDEADRLFEMGFQIQLGEIVSRTPDSRQTLLFSATMPKQLAEFARVKLREPDLIRLDTDVRVSETLNLAFFKIRPTERPAALIHLLRTQIDAKNHSTIVFCGTKHEVEFVGSLIRTLGVVPYTSNGSKNTGPRRRKARSRDEEELDDIEELRGVGIAHGTMDQEARTASLERFRSGKVKVFVVTDLAARGLDIPHVNNVINYDFPDRAKLFVHRVGRAARQGRPGTAYSLATTDEMGHVADVMLFLGRSLTRDEKGDALLGTIPQSIMDDETELVAQVVGADASLAQLQHSAANAHKMYVKTRAEASKRSIKRIKELVIRVHPLFGDSNGDAIPENPLENKGLVTVDRLAQYRPKRTTFEIEHSKGGTNSQAQAKTAAFLKQIRNRDEWRQQAANVESSEAMDDENIDDDDDLPAIISSDFSRIDPEVVDGAIDNMGKRKTRLSAAEKKRLKKRGEKSNQIADDPCFVKSKIVATPAPGAPTGAFRDSKFYVSNEASGRATDFDYESQLRINRLDDAVLDLGDDSDVSKAKRTFLWDKKKKRYVQATMKDHVEAKRMKKGAEALDVKNPGEAYDKWSRKTRKRIGGNGYDDGQDEGETDTRRIAQARKRAREEKRSQAFHAGRPVRDEVKTDGQFVKERMAKKRKADRLSGKSPNKRVKAGADAKAMRLGKSMPKPGQYSRSKLAGGRKNGKGGKRGV